MKKYLSILLCLLTFASCQTEQEPVSIPSQYERPDMWFASGDTLSPDQIDIFYIVSTSVLNSEDSLGQVSLRALLTEDERMSMDREFKNVRRNYAKGDYNLFAPYYHQFTFDAIGQPQAVFDSVQALVIAEICDAFDYYMAHLNQGRRFALVGFSQGAMLVSQLLRHMTDAQYGKMVAAYMMGYRLSAEDLRHPHIIAATDATTPGVTVSFNSVLDVSAAWSHVSADAAAAINPVSWSTDDTPAALDFRGDSLTVTLDPESKLLVVTVPDRELYHEWMRNNPAYVQAGVSLDCLHRWDLLFYAESIHDNIARRR